MILFDGRNRSAWAAPFHGRSEAEQLYVWKNGVFEFKVAPGDVMPKMSGERAELYKSVSGMYPEGREVWMAWETMFPADFVANSGGWNYTFQLHGSDSTHQANLAVRVNNYGVVPFLEITMYGGQLDDIQRRDIKITDDLQRGKWYQFVLHQILSPNGMGLFEGWVCGKRFADERDWPTTYAGENCYPKQGFYRGASDVHTRVLHRPVQIATELHEVLR